MVPATGNVLVDRAIGVATFKRPSYEEVEADQNATTQAAIVVIVAAIAAGIGGLRDDGFGGLVGGLVGSLLGWVISAVLIYYVGTKLIPSADTVATPGEVLRTLGFASAPGVLSFLGIIPVLGVLALFIIGIWNICTNVMAIMTALEMTVARAIATAILAAVAAIIVLLIFGAIFGVAFGAV